MKTNTKIIFTEEFTFIWIIITHKTWIIFQFSNRYSSINQINVVRNQLTGKCLLILYLNVRPCPWTSIQHHHQIRNPWDHTCVRGSFCRTESFHVQCSLLSPKPYCTYLCEYFSLDVNSSEFEFPNEILTALEASLMEFVATSNTLFSGVHGLAARWAFGSLYRNKRHFC